MVTSQVALFLQGLSSHRVCTWGAGSRLELLEAPMRRLDMRAQIMTTIHLDTRDRVIGWMYSILGMWSKVKDHCLICYKPFLHFFQIH